MSDSTRVLVVTSSILGTHGQSLGLAQSFQRAAEQREGVSLTLRDVVADDLPHLGLEELSSWQVPEEERSAAQHELAARSDDLISEVLDHDVIVLAVPMYNLGIPSQLKAWFDRVLRAGRTFCYTENGPVGLVEGKRAILLGARGGKYAGTPMDSQTPHISHMLGLMGISQLDSVFAEGLNMGDDAKEVALTEAHQQIETLVKAL